MTINRVIYQANGARSPQLTDSTTNPAMIADTTRKSITKKIDALIKRILRSFSEDISKAPTGSLPIVPTPVFKFERILCAKDLERAIYD